VTNGYTCARGIRDALGRDGQSMADIGECGLVGSDGPYCLVCEDCALKANGELPEGVGISDAARRWFRGQANRAAFYALDYQFGLQKARERDRARQYQARTSRQGCWAKYLRRLHRHAKPQDGQTKTSSVSVYIAGKYTDPLVHRTVETAYERESPRSDVAEDIVEALAPLVARAVEKREAEDVGGWRIEAEEKPGQHGLLLLKVRLWWGQDTSIPPAVVMTLQIALVAPVLTVSMAGMGFTSDPDSALMEADDIARCIAWAWLEQRDRLKDLAGLIG